MWFQRSRFVYSILRAPGGFYQLFLVIFGSSQDAIVIPSVSQDGSRAQGMAAGTLTVPCTVLPVEGKSPTCRAGGRQLLSLNQDAKTERKNTSKILC